MTLVELKLIKLCLNHSDFFAVNKAKEIVEREIRMREHKESKCDVSHNHMLDGE